MDGGDAGKTLSIDTSQDSQGSLEGPPTDFMISPTGSTSMTLPQNTDGVDIATKKGTKAIIIVYNPFV